MSESGFPGRFLRKLGIRSKSTGDSKGKALDAPAQRLQRPQSGQGTVSRSQTPQPLYQYRPIKPDEIRLLVLVFKYPIRIDNIVFALYVTQLTGNRQHATVPFDLKYTAVSYAWNEDENPRGSEQDYLPCVEISNHPSGEGCPLTSR